MSTDNPCSSPRVPPETSSDSILSKQALVPCRRPAFGCEFVHGSLQPRHEIATLTAPEDRIANEDIDEERHQQECILRQRLAEPVQKDGHDRHLRPALGEMSHPSLECLQSLWLA